MNFPENFPSNFSQHVENSTIDKNKAKAETAEARSVSHRSNLLQFDLFNIGSALRSVLSYLFPPERHLHQEEQPTGEEAEIFASIKQMPATMGQFLVSERKSNKWYTTTT